MTRFHLHGALVLVSLCLLAVSGCSELLKFGVSGTVRDAVTGAPIQGALIRLDVQYTRNPPSPNQLAVEGSIAKKVAAMKPSTDKRGAFSLTLEEVDREIVYRAPKWYVVISKEGYAPARFTIIPDASGKPALTLIYAALSPERGSKKGQESSEGN